MSGANEFAPTAGMGEGGRGSNGNGNGNGLSTANNSGQHRGSLDQLSSSNHSQDSLNRSGHGSGHGISREGININTNSNRNHNISIDRPRKMSNDNIGPSRPPPPPSRRELVESPSTKSAYKDFYRALRLKEKESVEEAELFAIESLSQIPENLKWRVYLELADLLKRRNAFDEARKHYKCACEIQPLATQGWLEWSKMEEECGKLRESLKILRYGLKMCNFNEGLLTKAIRQQERLHKLKDARGMLSVLKYESIEKVWRAVLEGALLEARAGRLNVARKVLKFLIQNVPWYGPIYYEAYKLEEKNNNLESAISIVRKGLAELPRYGPLWFGLLKIVERADLAAERYSFFYGRVPVLAGMRNEVASSIRVISRELMWKVHFEHSQAQERAADIAAHGLLSVASELRSLASARNELLDEARKALIRSVLACPSNLRWKIWLVGARLEINAGQVVRARRLLCQALMEAPLKSRASVYLECSRIEEYSGNVDVARRILQKACEEVKSEWKLFLESVLLEARCGNVHAALEVANHALADHPGTGRLWAIYIQLCHRLECLVPSSQQQQQQPGLSSGGKESERDVSQDREMIDAFSVTNATGQKYVIPSKQDILLRALRDVPKSGEVWTEGARCRLNPLHTISFDIGGAQKFLGFAMQFTPQYGDTFIEVLRVELLSQLFIPRVLSILGLPISLFMSKFLSFDMETDTGSLLSNHDALYDLTANAMKAMKDKGHLKSSKSQAQAQAQAAHLDRSANTNIDEIIGKGLQQPEDYELSDVDFMSVPAPPLTEVDLASINSNESNNSNDSDGDTPNKVSVNPRLRRLMNLIAMEKLEFDIGIKESDCENLLLDNLIRRCINADPNYGVSWFYCRDNASDSPTAVMKGTLITLIREMVICGNVYVRAICHYIRDCYAKLTYDPSLSNQDVMINTNSKSIATPLPTNNNAASGARESPAMVLEESMYRQPSPSSSPSSGKGTGTPSVSVYHHDRSDPDWKQIALQMSHGTFQDQSRRIRDFLDDYNLAGSLMGNHWTVQTNEQTQSQSYKNNANENEKEKEGNIENHKNANVNVNVPVVKFIESIPMVDICGNVFTSTDFVTSIIVLNRVTFNRNLNADERRKVLYGSDAVLA